MNETAFVESRRQDWQKLERLVSSATISQRAVTRLARDQLRDLGTLYRRVSSDLAYCRAQEASDQIIAYLNGLVGSAHALLYAPDSRSWSGISSFFRQEIPRTFRRRLPFFWISLAVTLAGATAAFLLVKTYEPNVDLIIPPDSPLRSSLDAWTRGTTETQASDPEAAVFASALMVNNSRVSLNAFALGILGGLPTIIVLFYNGMVLGAFAAMVHHAGTQATFWPGVLPHGVVEITEILISGAAGLSLGWAVLAPGELDRREALTLAARDSVKLILGGVILLLFAAITEAFVSHSSLPTSAKLTVAVFSGVALYTYLAAAGREEITASDGASDPDTGSPHRR